MLRFDWVETYGHLEKEMPRKYQEKYQSDLWLCSQMPWSKKGQDSTACQINCREIFLLISYFNYQTDLSTKKCIRKNCKNAPKSFKT